MFGDRAGVCIILKMAGHPELVCEDLNDRHIDPRRKVWRGLNDAFVPIQRTSATYADRGNIAGGQARCCQKVSDPFEDLFHRVHRAKLLQGLEFNSGQHIG